MNISNQKPAVITPGFIPPAKGNFEPADLIRDVMVKPLFTPLVPGAPVSITNNNGQNVSEDDIMNDILQACQPQPDMDATDRLNALYGASCAQYDAQTPMTFRSFFPVQSACAASLPYPTPTLIYTADNDIIPSCKSFLAGVGSYDTMFVSFAFFARPEVMGVYFANETSWDQFKNWMYTTIAPLLSQNVLPYDTVSLLNQFRTLSLSGLTQSVMLRNTDADGNDPFSFARLLYQMVMQYVQSNQGIACGLLPFDLAELFCPRALLFVNIEAHAHASAKQVAKEWQMIATANTARPYMVSNRKLMSLTAVARATASYTAASQMLASGRSHDLAHTKNIRFQKTVPTKTQTIRRVRLISQKMANVTHSDNTYKKTNTTYLKPSRRDPDNHDMKGKRTQTLYYPDIHVYLDTSGSISESNYQEAVKCLITLAKKLNVNLYINCFADAMTQCVKLHTKDKTPRQIYAEFLKIPKITGGTDFSLVWNYINMSKKRSRELSLMVTDMEYAADSHYIRHPRNLYYIPCSNMDINRIHRSAEYFLRTMRHIDPNLRRKLLM